MKNLWTEKYKPSKTGEIAGQQKAISEALAFMDSFEPGKALLLTGPAGTGKTLLVETLARERSLLLLQLNASDSRNAEGILGFFEDSTRTKSLFHSGKIILIDEVDGISANDKGAVSAITKIIKQSLYPVFLIANDPWAAKLRPLRPYVKMVKFSKVHSSSIEKRLKEICEKEGISVKGTVLKDLARWSQGDLRSAISDLQTVAQGKNEISEEDLEILGYRERESSIFEILPTVFKSRSISASRKAIQSVDKDPDEVFWWIENNIPLEFPPEKLAQAYDLLSKANMLRNNVAVQQNWRFKAIMTDMISGISVVKGEAHAPHHGFMMYQAPQKIMMMGRTKSSRAALNSLCKKIGGVSHTSTRVVKRDYLPYMRIILKKEKPAETHSAFSVNFNKEEIALIVKV
ncbi:MAG: replication factor C large subunit [Candidatus Aenigmarchaeota archaeon]|nr:replication factor C large subunit [Candidatus Aenigmarchaeota archaeon]